jgi:hypothetical protein
MSKQHTPADFDAVVRLCNVETLDGRQEIRNRTIAMARTSRTISAECGLAGVKSVLSVNP